MLTLAVLMPLFIPQLRIAPSKRSWQILLLLFLIVTITALLLSNSFIFGLIGFPTLPIGSATILAAIWVGWSVTRMIEHEQIYILIIISACLSLAIAIILNSIPTQDVLASRLVGFHEHSLAWAIYMGVGSILTFWKFIKSKQLAWLYGLLSIIFIGAIGFSGSRMALLTTLIAIIAMAFILWNQPWPNSKLLVLLAVILAILLPISMTPRLNNTSYAVESINYRVDLAKAGLRILKDHPLGIGYGNIGRYTFSPDLPSQLLEPYHRQILLESSHNLWIDVAIGFGLLGGAICILMTGYLLHIAWSKASKTHPMPAIGTSFLLVNFLTTPASITTLVLLGIFIGLVIADSEKPRKSNASWPAS